MTPIGNPQNLLIAIQSGIQLPFTTFVTILSIPTIINLILTYMILKVYFRNELLQLGYGMVLTNLDKQKENNFDADVADSGSRNIADNNIHTTITNSGLAKISVIILLVMISGFIVTEILQFLNYFSDRGLSTGLITILGAIVLYTVSKERAELIKSVDYSVLIFFAAMFVFTAGLWTSGLISEIISFIPNPLPTSSVANNNAIIATISVTMCQVLSNVPFVALYNLVLINNGFTGHNVYEWMMLAAASDSRRKSHHSRGGK